MRKPSSSGSKPATGPANGEETPNLDRPAADPVIALPPDAPPGHVPPESILVPTYTETDGVPDPLPDVASAPVVGALQATEDAAAGAIAAAEAAIQAAEAAIQQQVTAALASGTAAVEALNASAGQAVAAATQATAQAVAATKAPAVDTAILAADKGIADIIKQAEAATQAALSAAVSAAEQGVQRAVQAVKPLTGPPSKQ